MYCKNCHVFFLLIQAVTETFYFWQLIGKLPFKALHVSPDGVPVQLKKTEILLNQPFH